MSTAKYENRRNFEMSHWPQLRQAWNDMLKPIFPGREVSGELRQMVFTAASLASGCLMIRKRTQHASLSGLDSQGTFRNSRHVDDAVTPCDLRERHGADHPTPTGSMTP